MTKQPNILIIIADQLAAQYLPAYGHKVVKTPAIDALAAQGVVFDAAYTNSPLCAPARAVFMSGCLPSTTGVFDNAAEFPATVPTFAHYLRLQGYRTCLSGKMHFVGPDQLHGFEERLTTDIYPADFGWTPDWSKPGARIDWWYHNMTSVKQAGIAEITNQLEYDDEVGFLAQRKLYDYARAAEKKPFCLTVSFTHPHDPYAARPEFWNLYKDEDIDLPKVAALPPHEMDAHSRRLYEACAMQEYDINEADIRKSRHGYYASISYIDSHVQKLVATLKACNLDEDTIIILTSDHGDFLGERGLWYKMSYRDPAARIPFIVHAPNRFKPHRVAAPISLADILPTLVDFAGKGGSEMLASPIDGRSLLPLLEGDSQPGAVTIGEYLAEGVHYPMHMIRQEEWKYIACGTDPEQLFDMKNDPLENHNLAEDPQQKARVTAFRAVLKARFDVAQINTRVLNSQKARLTLFQALTKGKLYPWDYQPLRQASEQYTRNHRDVTETDVLSRYPLASEAEKKAV